MEHSLKVKKVAIGVAGVVGHEYVECVDECADLEDYQE